MGTTVVTGRGILRVTKTRTKTELGQIAASLSEHVEEDTPLEVRLKAFSKVLTYIVVAATLVILVVGVAMGREFLDMLRISIILVIAAVPEGLLIAVTVAQILWIHLICDGPLDIVLSFEPKEEGVMDEKPRPLKAPILTHLTSSLIGVISITSAIFALFLFGHYYHIHNNPVEGQSIVFASFAINSIVYIFAYRSLRLPLYRMNPLNANKPLIWAVVLGFVTVFIAFLIPGLRSLLGIVPLTRQEWLWVFSIAFTLLIFVEIGKAVSNRVHANDR